MHHTSEQRFQYQQRTSFVKIKRNHTSSECLELFGKFAQANFQERRAGSFNQSIHTPAGRGLEKKDA
jgi:hypothetical protein